MNPIPVLLAAVALAGCTFVYIEGDNNRLNDTGGDTSLKRRAPENRSNLSDLLHPNEPKQDTKQ